MPPLDHLPAEQLATLRLIVTGRSYSDVAADLAIETDTVARNSRLAVSALAGESSESLTTAERGQVADWLLGETEVEPLVSGSPAARTFAEAARRELERIDGARLPDLPPISGPSPKEDAPHTQAASSAAVAQDRPRKSFLRDSTDSAGDGSGSNAGPAPTTTPATVGVITRADGANGQAHAGTPEISRRGGIALLAAAAVALVVGIVALTGGFEGDGDSGRGGSAQGQANGNTGQGQSGGQQDQSSSGSKQGAGWTLRRRYTLKSTTGAKAAGVAGLESRGTQNALLVAGTGLPAGKTVGIWLTGGPQPGLVGFQKVNAKGEFTAIGPVPKVAPEATAIVVTSESVSPGGAVPTTPGPELLSSPFSL